jgi:hypothetical protein
MSIAAAHPTTQKPSNQRASTAILAIFAAAAFILHICTNWRYGYFRDELYYLDCGRHLSFGYADMAPFVPVLARISLILGGSLTAVRLWGDIACALAVVLTILIARELGGGRFAQALSAICVMLAPALMTDGSFLTTNTFEPVFWMACIWTVLRIQNTGNSRLWLWFGVFAGFAIENKHSALFFLFAVLAGVLLTPLRSELKIKWLWYGVAVIFLLSLPNFLWQATHHWATYELLRNVQKMHKNIVLGPGEFFLRQVLAFNPLCTVVWIVGLAMCFARERWRVLAFIWTAMFVIMVALKAKDYYFFPIVPMLFAAGAVAWQDWSERRRWLRPALLAFVIAADLLTLPFGVPILSPERFVAYERALHSEPPKTEVAHSGPLPQYYGDQFGWEALVREVAADYNALPPEERSRTWIFANNYGEAGAIDMFGAQYGLPRAISAHQNHFFWGPPFSPVGEKGTNLIVLQDSVEGLSKVCDGVRVLSEHHDRWGMEEENQPILYCQSLKYSLKDLWPRLKHWN